jgi:hypothetical protein
VSSSKELSTKTQSEGNENTEEEVFFVSTFSSTKIDAGTLIRLSLVTEEKVFIISYTNKEC